MRTIWIALVASLALTLAACHGSLHDVIADHAKGEGTKVLYSVDTPRAWAIARDVLHAEGVDAIEDHQADGYVLAYMETGIMKPGARIGVWISPDGPTHSSVTVLTEATSGIVGVGLTETTFHKEFAQRVATPVVVTTSAPQP